MNVDYKKLKKFIEVAISNEIKEFNENNSLRDPKNFNLPENNEETIFIDDKGNITKVGLVYLLNDFSAEGDRENLYFDQGYYCGFKTAMQNILEILNTKSDITSE